jgi:hypothetical protein
VSAGWHTSRGISRIKPSTGRRRDTPCWGTALCCGAVVMSTHDPYSTERPSQLSSRFLRFGSEFVTLCIPKLFETTLIGFPGSSRWRVHFPVSYSTTAGGLTRPPPTCWRTSANRYLRVGILRKGTETHGASSLLADGAETAADDPLAPNRRPATTGFPLWNAITRCSFGGWDRVGDATHQRR